MPVVMEVSAAVRRRASRAVQPAGTRAEGNSCRAGKGEERGEKEMALFHGVDGWRVDGLDGGETGRQCKGFPRGKSVKTAVSRLAKRIDVFSENAVWDIWRAGV
jgi:hypothetical protein